MQDNDWGTEARPPEASGATRRAFLRKAGLTAGFATAGLSGAGSLFGPFGAVSEAFGATPPKRGRILRLGLTGGGSDDTLDPNVASTLPSYAGMAMIYDTLIEYDNNLQPRYALATELHPNANGSKWTIRLRSGVTFHNGKDLTADDLIFTLHRILKSTFFGQLFPIHLAGVKKLDNLTVEVPFTRPWSILPQVLPANGTFPVLPVGFDVKKPVGTGPFKLTSFTPGQGMATVRNDDFWLSGQPYLNGVTLTEYADEASMVNAIVGGQEDVVTSLTGVSLPQLKAGGVGTVISNSGAWNPIFVRADVKPFDDVRVRQALRLVVDRPQMVGLVFGGHGKLGNDLFGVYDPLYDNAIPQRVQDIDQAKSLLKQAGQSDLRMTLTTANVAEGMLKQAQVFAQDAQAAGVTVNVDQVDVSILYGPQFQKWPCSMDTWGWVHYLVQARLSSIAPPMVDEAHWTNPQYSKLFSEAVATTDATKQAELVHEMQMIEWQSGAFIIPNFNPIIDAYGSKVVGLAESLVGTSLNAYQQLKTISLA